MVHVLVVDDDVDVQDVLALCLREAGFEVATVGCGSDALVVAHQTEFDVAIVDLHMPGLSGMDTARRVKDLTPDTEIIILTGHPSVTSSIDAIHERVFDYICKPIEITVLTRAVQRAVERRQLLRENRRMLRQLVTGADLVSSIPRRFKHRETKPGRGASASSTDKASTSALVRGIGGLIGNSEAIAQVRDAIAEVAPSEMSVLIRGESGTGKDIVARLIHELSDRKAGGAFVKISCPAIPEALLESELFGHEEGAFTGATRRKPGRFELSRGGTVFLDEIGAIPPTVQAKLLQVVEHRQCTRVGGTEPIHVEARIVAATNAPLERMITEGHFRLDLFYRLNEYAIEMPPLRQRSEDIPVLLQHFLREESAQREGVPLSLSQGMVSQLIGHHWPGNVRELKTVVRRFALTGREETFGKTLEPLRVVAPGLGNNGNAATDQAPGPFTEGLRAMEIRTIMAALNDARWNQRHAAKILGMSYSSLRRRVSKYNLKSKSPFLPPIS